MTSFPTLVLAVFAPAVTTLAAWHYRSLLFSPRGNCPLCKSASLLRTPRRRHERWLSHLVECKKFRCPACGWVGMLRLKPDPMKGHPMKGQGVEPEMGSTTEIAVPGSLVQNTERA